MPLLPRPATAANGSMSARWFKDARRFMSEWFKYHWADLVCMVVTAGICLGLKRSPAPITRNFPITFDTSGDVVNLDLAYPDRGWILPSWLAGCLSIGLPIVVYSLAQIRLRSAWDADAAIMGTIWAVLLATLFQVTTKVLVSGFRPSFLSVCKPDLSLLQDPYHNATGLNGVGFLQVMYTTEICTETDPLLLRNAMTSFPSGHSAAGFSGYGFLHLWLNSKLKTWADYRPAFWKLVVTMLPLLAALLNACILTVDAAHHWYDALAGSAIGSVMAVAAYRATHAAVWDWRYNHLRLNASEAFTYNVDYNFNDNAGLTLTGKAGWGRNRNWVREALDSAESSAVFAGHEQAEARERSSTAHGQSSGM